MQADKKLQEQIPKFSPSLSSVSFFQPNYSGKYKNWYLLLASIPTLKKKSEKSFIFISLAVQTDEGPFLSFSSLPSLLSHSLCPLSFLLQLHFPLSSFMFFPSLSICPSLFHLSSSFPSPLSCLDSFSIASFGMSSLEYSAYDQSWNSLFEDKKKKKMKKSYFFEMPSLKEKNRKSVFVDSLRSSNFLRLSSIINIKLKGLGAA